MINAYKKFWLGYISFHERTSRIDFWLALASHAVVALVLLGWMGIFSLLSNSVLPDIWSIFAYFLEAILGIYIIFAILPFLAMLVRRLRDANIPWALIFLIIVPFGAIALLILSTLSTSQSQIQISEFKEPKYDKPRIVETGDVSIIQAVKNFFLGYIDFRGKTTRQSFWWCQGLLAILFAILLGLLAGIAALEISIFGIPTLATWSTYGVIIIFAGLVILPEMALITRRFRDVGLKNGAAILIYSIAAAFFVLDSSIQYVNARSFGIHNFTLLNYFVFLLIFILGLIILLVTIMPTNELAREEESLLFRKK